MADGNFGLGMMGAKESEEVILKNRSRLALLASQSTLVYITYKNENGTLVENFCRYGDADSPVYNQDELIPCDGLVTRQRGRQLVLPLADCVGAVLYDQRQKICMVSHLGRHSTEQRGAYHSVQYLQHQYGSETSDVLVWLSPGAGNGNYPLYAFDNRSLHDVITEQLIESGVPRKNIEISSVDTTTDRHYYSQSEFTKGNRDKNGRFVIYAMLR